MMRKGIVIILVLFLVLAALPISPARAQTETSVYVTTQDFSALRAGPGRAFDRLAVVPPAVTLPAIGRTADGGWIQVQYGDLRGWIRWWLVIWSGDMLSLPLDGIDPLPYARRMLIGWSVGEIPVYDRPLSSPDQVIGHVSGRVELTGRFGSGEALWLQFWHEGRYYWARSWNFNIILHSGSPILNLPDGAIVYAYGRLMGRVRLGLERSEDSFRQIASLWRSLAAGQDVSCDSLPDPAPVPTLTDEDLSLEPAFVPAAEALLEAIDHTNAAVSMFEQACAQPDRMLPPDLVAQALAEVEAAGRGFTLAQTMVSPMANNEALLSGDW